MADRIRTGVIGAHAQYGWAKSTHLPALAASPDYEVTAVASTGIEAALAAAKAWGAHSAYDDARELIESPDVDLVVLAVQLPLRENLVEAAVAAGKHVYCEWPLARDAATARAMHAAAQRAGVRHAVGLQSRNHPAVRFVRDLVADGYVGDVLSVAVNYSLSTPQRWPGRYAWVFEQDKRVDHVAIVAGHGLDMARSIVGDVTQLSATLSTRIPRMTLMETGEQIEVTSADQIVVNGLLAGGAALSAHIVTGAQHGDGHRIEIHGTAGRLTLIASDDSLVGPGLSVLGAQGAAAPKPLQLPESLLAGLPDLPPAPRNVHQVYAGLAHAIRTGEAAEPDFGTAVRTLEILDAIRESGATGERRNLS